VWFYSEPLRGLFKRFLAEREIQIAHFGLTGRLNPPLRSGGKTYRADTGQQITQAWFAP
jgi:hypothetical protein